MSRTYLDRQASTLTGSIALPIGRREYWRFSLLTLRCRPLPRAATRKRGCMSIGESSVLFLASHGCQTLYGCGRAYLMANFATKTPEGWLSQPFRGDVQACPYAIVSRYKERAFWKCWTARVTSTTI